MNKFGVNPHGPEWFCMPHSCFSNVFQCRLLFVCLTMYIAVRISHYVYSCSYVSLCILLTCLTMYTVVLMSHYVYYYSHVSLCIQLFLCLTMHTTIHMSHYVYSCSYVSLCIYCCSYVSLCIQLFVCLTMYTNVCKSHYVHRHCTSLKYRSRSTFIYYSDMLIYVHNI